MSVAVLEGKALVSKDL